MKATKIRTQNLKVWKRQGEKPDQNTLEHVCTRVVSMAAKLGFITGAEVIGATAIKIGLHMRSFRIDTASIGHNARVGSAAYGYNGNKSPKGYKRTDVPTWEQREDFNHLVNAVFDHFGLSANIVSGAYTVRNSATGPVRSWYYGGDRAAGYSGHASEEIMTEKDARESLGSDRLEKEHAEKTKVERREKSKAYRAKVRAAKASKFIAFSEYDWKSRGYIVNVITHAQFLKLNAKRSYRKLKLSDMVPVKGKSHAEALKNLQLQGLRGG